MAALQSARQVFKNYRYMPGFDRLLDKVEVVAAENGNLHCKVLLTEEHLNIHGILHGGFTSTLIDNISTFSLLTIEKPTFGVSVDLNISFLASATKGDTLNIKSEMLKCGKTLGFTAISVEDQNGKLIAVARQTLAIKK